MVETDLFANLGDATFDLILCNPPYVTANAVAAFPAEHKSEPVMAHLGGADGMDLVRRLMSTAGSHLTPGGTLVVEVGQGRSILERDYPDLPFVWFDTEHSRGEVFALPASAVQVDMKPGGKRSVSRAAKSKTPRRA